VRRGAKRKKQYWGTDDDQEKPSVCKMFSLERSGGERGPGFQQVVCATRPLLWYRNRKTVIPSRKSIYQSGDAAKKNGHSALAKVEMEGREFKASLEEGSRLPLIKHMILTSTKRS